MFVTNAKYHWRIRCYKRADSLLLHCIRTPGLVQFWTPAYKKVWMELKETILSFLFLWGIFSYCIELTRREMLFLLKLNSTKFTPAIFILTFSRKFTFILLILIITTIAFIIKNPYLNNLNSNHYIQYTLWENNIREGWCEKHVILLFYFLMLTHFPLWC